ncbi:O-succinylbenzoic acid--CoA ligase [Tenacibaculum sp. 190524A05c]|uniref:AMP-binding protein n=1 Tax=Tenacibaculum platacis TaxID=3137852 RepID=UPI0031FB61BE
MNFKKTHPSFKLNGNSFQNNHELLEYADQFSSSVKAFLEDWFNDNAFVIVQTSGSTGKPKPIKLQKDHMINSAKATGEFFSLKENTKALLCMSSEYIAGKMMLVRAMVLGWNIDLVEPVSNPLIGVDKNYDFSAMVPMQLQNSLNELYKVKSLIVGGGVVSEKLKQQISDVQTKVYATYGMTETITHIAVKKLNHFNTVPAFYKILPNVDVSIDSRGCLIINASKVASDLVVTNDVVQLVSENEFEWLGRYDNVINSGGIKLHPEKIEHKLSKVIQNRFFVAGITDELLGEKLVLIIEDKLDEINVEKMLDVISNNKDLTKYEIPKEVFLVEEFIETETKKIQRSKTLDLIIK